MVMSNLQKHFFKTFKIFQSSIFMPLVLSKKHLIKTNGLKIDDSKRFKVFLYMLRH